MNTLDIEQHSPVAQVVHDAFRPLRSDIQRERILRWGGAGLSLAILAAVGTAIGTVDIDQIVARIPASPTFWALFAIAYLLGPASEWLIYRRLWSLPVAGFVPLLRKQVANEVLLGYSGEAQFYLWARRHAGLQGSPFGTIKDVAVLSALAGNIVTLAMMVAMAPLLVQVMDGSVARTFAVSVLAIVISSLAMFVLRRRLFSLSGGALRAIFGIHVGRLLISIAVTAALWSLVLPGITLSWWLALATVRLMLSRLPLLPNKDILFSGLTLLLLGRDADVTAVMAVMASLMLAAHLIVGLLAGARALVTDRVGRC